MEQASEYKPPCRLTTASKVTCEACQKRITLHTLLYRHVCRPMTERVRCATDSGQAAVRARAEASLEAEQSAKYAHLFQL
eukprot:12112387-Alexandrium_andersonii.AAC.1